MAASVFLDSNWNFNVVGSHEIFCQNWEKFLNLCCRVSDKVLPQGLMLYLP